MVFAESPSGCFGAVAGTALPAVGVGRAAEASDTRVLQSGIKGPRYVFGYSGVQRERFIEHDTVTGMEASSGSRHEHQPLTSVR